MQSAWVIPFPLHPSTTVLVAVIIPRSPISEGVNHSSPKIDSPLGEQIRKLIHGSLPSHMWPFWIVVWPSSEDIPVTVNGKISIPDMIERCKLALDLESERNTSRKFEDSEIRSAVVQIWKHALPVWEEIESREVDDLHFLTLGGSSLSVMWCVEKIICEFGIIFIILFLNMFANYDCRIGWFVLFWRRDTARVCVMFC